MLKIGFGGTYYTLWEVTSAGHTYIKNISTSLEEAQNEYPEAEVDLSLKGTSFIPSGNDFVPVNYEEMPHDRYLFGQYRDLPITSDNLSYLSWYYTNSYMYNKAQTEFIKSILEENGYKVVERMVITPEELEEARTYMDEVFNPIKNAVENNLPVEVFVERNLDYHKSTNCEGATLKFKEVKEMSYQGYPYYLPVLNGKAKRIKNKKMTITKYTAELVDNSAYPYYVIRVYDFNVA